MITNDEFRQFLIQQGYYNICFPSHSPQKYYAIVRKLFNNYSIIEGTIGDLVGYDREWLYKTYAMAVSALLQWSVAKFADFPLGWIRNYQEKSDD